MLKKDTFLYNKISHAERDFFKNIGLFIIFKVPIFSMLLTHFTEKIFKFDFFLYN